MNDDETKIQDCIMILAAAWAIDSSRRGVQTYTLADVEARMEKEMVAIMDRVMGNRSRKNISWDDHAMIFAGTLRRALEIVGEEASLAEPLVAQKTISKLLGDAGAELGSPDELRGIVLMTSQSNKSLCLGIIDGHGYEKARCLLPAKSAEEFAHLMLQAIGKE